MLYRPRQGLVCRERTAFKWTTVDAQETLLGRRKGQCLTWEKMRALKCILQKYPGDAWQIEETYKLPASTLYGISRADEKSLWNMSKWMWDAIKAKGVSAQVGHNIQSILRQSRTPITLSEIQVEVNERQDTSVWKSRIIKFIKGMMKFSYTKGISRLPKVHCDWTGPRRPDSELTCYRY